MNRRNLIKTAGLAISGSVILPFDALAKTTSENPSVTTSDNTTQLVSDKRKLGKLEVSAIGLGVQNMHRTYHTIVPSRKEMHNIIQSAFDNGVTLFDTAEAYGPFECEKILGGSNSII